MVKAPLKRYQSPATTDLRGRRFESVFRPDKASNDGMPRYRIVGSGVQRWPTDAPATSAVVAMLKCQGIDAKQRSMGSPANCDSYHLDVAFLDGGLHATTGNYWFGEKGAWIHGTQAVVWVARNLGVGMPGALRRQRPPNLPDGLLTAYLSTEFVVSSGQEPIVRLGEPPPEELIELMDEKNTKLASVVTAYNPYSVPLSNDVNLLRQQFLQQELDERNLPWIDAEGRDPTGQWPAERSLLVFGATQEDLDQLLVDYQQHAAVLVTVGEPARLVLHPRTTRSSAERTHKRA